MLKNILAIAVCTMLVAPSIMAQQEPTPAPAEEQAPSAVPAGGQPGPSDESAGGLAPDTSRPLSGVEDYQVESPARARNFIVPSLRLSAFGDSNRTIVGTGTSGLELTGSIVGNIAAHRISRRNEFTLDYIGGGMIYARSSELNAMTHQLGFTETYTGRRWGLTIGDRMSYLPESAYGFGGFGPTTGFGGGFGGGMGNWNPAVSGGQNLFTGYGNRIANSAMTQLTYNASARSSLTFSGAYGLLRFLDSSEGIDSDFGTASAGYNYALNKRDTIAVSYGFGAYRYKGSDFQMDNHFVNLSYGRKLTGRLAFQLSGGPQFIITRDPSAGSQSRISWNARTSLNYRISGTSLGFYYSHYTSAGSGLHYGATTDRFYGSIGRQLTRHWYWSVGPGYSHNARLQQGPTVSSASSYNSVFASTGLHRGIGEYTDLSFSYSLHSQWSDAQNPNSINQGSSYLRHMFGVSLTFHTPRIAMN